MIFYLQSTRSYGKITPSGKWWNYAFKQRIFEFYFGAIIGLRQYNIQADDGGIFDLLPE